MWSTYSDASVTMLATHGFFAVLSLNTYQIQRTANKIYQCEWTQRLWICCDAIRYTFFFPHSFYLLAFVLDRIRVRSTWRLFVCGKWTPWKWPENGSLHNVHSSYVLARAHTHTPMPRIHWHSTPTSSIRRSILRFVFALYRSASGKVGR